MEMKDNNKNNHEIKEKIIILKNKKTKNSEVFYECHCEGRVESGLKDGRGGVTW